jgi:hypothetical protein
MLNVRGYVSSSAETGAPLMVRIPVLTPNTRFSLGIAVVAVLLVGIIIQVKPHSSSSRVNSGSKIISVLPPMVKVYEIVSTSLLNVADRQRASIVLSVKSCRTESNSTPLIE